MCKPLRLLVVDDCNFARNIITQSLKVFFGDQIVVETAENLKQTQALDLRSFDMVIADLDLFGGSGLEILVHLRRLDLLTPFVVMTGYNIEEVFERFSSNFSQEEFKFLFKNFEILLKPFNIIRLRELVTELVTTPALRE